MSAGVAVAEQKMPMIEISAHLERTERNASGNRIGVESRNSTRLGGGDTPLSNGNKVAVWECTTSTDNEFLMSSDSF